MKKRLAMMLSILCTSYAFAIECPPATPTNHPDFCTSFKVSAQCYCRSTNSPDAVCDNMDALYNMMMIRYWSLKRACKSQNQVPVQDCIDAWTCYRNGGKDSKGRLCSATGKAC